VVWGGREKNSPLPDWAFLMNFWMSLSLLYVFYLQNPLSIADEKL
jgi:hypothetical protein